MLTENQKKRFEMEDELDFSFGIQNLARFRGNCFKQRGCVSMVIRQIPFNIKTFEELGLPNVIAELADRPRGLVLVTGPTGSGKSTTLAAMIDKINRERRRATSSRSKIRSSSSTATRAASSTSARSAPTRRASRRAQVRAASGPRRRAHRRNARPGDDPGRRSRSPRRVTSRSRRCTRTRRPRRSTASSTSSRAHQQSQVRAQLAFVLEGIITQTLLPKAKGRGRAMAAEILVVTPAIRALIRDDKIHQIYSIDAVGKEVRHADDERRAVPAVHEREVALDEVPARVAAIQNEFLRMIGESPMDDGSRANGSRRR